MRALLYWLLISVYILFCGSCKTAKPELCDSTHLANCIKDKNTGMCMLPSDEKKKEINTNMSAEVLTFKIVVHQLYNPIDSFLVSNEMIAYMTQILNEGFKDAKIKFELTETKVVNKAWTYEDLKENSYRIYFNELGNFDDPSAINIYLVDHQKGLCKRDAYYASCAKGRGFSLIGHKAPSIVICKEDVADAKVPIHEFGHFFNLEHTHGDFNEAAKDDDCTKKGDGLCSTPPDPGAAAYTAMVNFTTCEMFGAYDENGAEYKPMIHNFMAYYPPCYMRKYSFTDEQLEAVHYFAHSPDRLVLVRK
jgi:hypothetical protein